MKCTHCGKELAFVRKSNPIPDVPDAESEICYIMCNSCSNIMTAMFKDGEMINVQPTPETDTPETRAMMKQAAELFKLNGSMFYTQKVSSTSVQERIEHNDHVKETIDNEEPTPQQESHCDCCNNNYHQDYETPAIKEPNVFKKLLRKFLSIFKR